MRQEWRHIPGEENPADLASRGLEADDDANWRKFHFGPTWLNLPEADWPSIFSPIELCIVGATREYPNLEKDNSQESWCLKITEKLENWSSKESDEFCEKIAMQKINWSFGPPLASHYGGLWERAVRMTKKHLLATIPDQMDIDTFSTILAEVSGQSLRASWGKVKEVINHFWTRWSNEYLTSLQKRVKWSTSTDTLQRGKIVLLVDPIIPRNGWRTGVVEEVWGDGVHNREACIRLSNGKRLRRHIRSIVPLEMDD